MTTRKTCTDCAHKNKCMDRSRNYVCAFGFEDKDKYKRGDQDNEENADQINIRGTGSGDWKQ